MNIKAKAQRGLSMLEIMVCLAILGVVGAMVVPNLMDKPDKARQVAAQNDVRTIYNALRMYRMDKSRYPSAQEGLRALTQREGTAEPYLDKLPNDPWNNPYVYINPGIHNAVDVMSYGADGKPGGEGVDSDIGSWQ